MRNVHFCQDEDSLTRAIGELGNAPVLGIDVETTGLDPFTSKLLLVSIGTVESQFVLDARRVDVKRLLPLLMSGKPIVGHNLKFDYKFLKLAGLDIENPVDTMLIEQVLDSGRSEGLGLDAVYSEYFFDEIDKGLQTSFVNHSGEFSMEQIEYSGMDIIYPLQILDRQIVRAVLEGVEHIVKIECGCSLVFGDIELNGILLDKNLWTSIYKKSEVEVRSIAEKMDRAVGSDSPIGEVSMFGGGTSYNYDSNKQIVNIFKRLGIKAASSGADVLQDIEHPFAELLLNYRGHKKILSTYGEGFLDHISPVTGRVHPSFRQMGADTGRVSCVAEGESVLIRRNMVSRCVPIEGVVAGDDAYTLDSELRVTVSRVTCLLKTGRERVVELRVKTVSNTPTELSVKLTPDHRVMMGTGKFVRVDNLRWGDVLRSVLGVCEVVAISEDPVRRNVYDLEVENTHNFMAGGICVHNCTKPNLQNIPANSEFRSCFVAPEGRSLITADYSGCELRIIAELSQDPKFLEVFLGGGDLHSMVATMIFSKPVSKKENVELRNRAKAINFGLAYGMAADGLAKQLRGTKEEATSLLSKYFALFPKIKSYLDASGRRALSIGYSETIGGRRRYYDVYDAADDNQKLGHIERQGKNHPIQGTNADLTKLALIFLRNRFKPTPEIKIVNTVHDEIVVECPDGVAEEVRSVVLEEMERSGSYYIKSIPVVAEAGVGKVWGK